MRIVFVEDNLQLATAIAAGLAEEGHVIELVDTAAAAIERGLRGDLDLMLLDLGLPDRDGLDVLRELHARRVRVPVLVLTARDTIDARSAALDLGAADYLIKPLAFAELIGRIAALDGAAGGAQGARKDR